MFSSVLSMPYDGNRVLFSSVRLLRDRIVFISVPGRDAPIAWEEFEVYDVERNLNLTRHIAQDNSWENISILSCIDAYLASINKITIDVSYKNLKQRFFLSRHIESSCGIAVMTLFWPDRELLPAFLKHYTQLGVDKFYLYANVILTETHRAQLVSLASEYSARVHFVQFEHSYYHDAQKPSRHYGQMMAINDFLYWSADFAESILLVDLDEYLYLNAPLIIQPKHCYSFYSYFGQNKSEVSYLDFKTTLDKPLSLIKLIEIDRRLRCKSLFNPRDVIGATHGLKLLKNVVENSLDLSPAPIPATGIHRPKVVATGVADEFISPDDGFICHVANFVENSKFFSQYESAVDIGNKGEVTLSSSKSFHR